MGIFYHRSGRLANFTHMPLRYVEAAKIADEGVTMGVVQALGVPASPPAGLLCSSALSE